MSSTPEQTKEPGYKVLLVEDHPMFRELVGQLINRDLGMEVCGEADNIRDAMDLIREKQPQAPRVTSPRMKLHPKW